MRIGLHCFSISFVDNLMSNRLVLVHVPHGHGITAMLSAFVGSLAIDNLVRLETSRYCINMLELIDIRHKCKVKVLLNYYNSN